MLKPFKARCPRGRWLLHTRVHPSLRLCCPSSPIFRLASRDAPDNSLSSRVHLASRFQRASLHRRRNPSCSEPGVLPLSIPFSNLRLYTTLRPHTLFVRAPSSIFLRHVPSLSARLPASSRDPGTLKTAPQQLVTRLRFLNCAAIICLFFFFATRRSLFFPSQLPR